MRIYTKKSFEFKNVAGDKVVTQPLSFTDVPDWAAKDQIFKWGKEDGDIMVTETAKEEAAAEKTADDTDAQTIADAEAAAKAEAEAKAEADDKAKTNKGK
ncbi:hypothetical protein [Sporomusa aerivorans]|uniref:hypothetical protein n=1 Tax=Sporomusa aerivorans TaxID=204936 RepID=UPI00352AF9BC